MNECRGSRCDNGCLIWLIFFMCIVALARLAQVMAVVESIKEAMS